MSQGTSFTLVLLIAAAGTHAGSADGAARPHERVRLVQSSYLDTVRVTPGSPMVVGTRVQLGTHRFLAYKLRCDTSVVDTGALVGEWRGSARLVRRRGKPFLEHVTHSPNVDGHIGVDSALYDPQTLAPTHEEFRFGGYSETFDFGNGRVSWHVRDWGGRATSSVDTLVRPAFLQSSDILLIQAIQPEQLQSTVLLLEFVVVGGGQEPGDEDGVSYRRGFMLLRGSDSLLVRGLGKRDAWVIGIGSGFDKQYWIDKQTREVLAWELAQTEGMCGMRYVRAP